MKQIYVFVCFVALVCVCSGQTTTFSPKSQCGIGALKCYTDQKVSMKSKIDTIDFASACHIFRTILDCMENVGDCGNDADYLTVRQGCIDDLDGICGIDGSLQSCGIDTQVCFNELETVLADVNAKNFTAACPLINSFAVCVQNVVQVKQCSPALVAVLNITQQMLNSDKQIVGCDGQCAQEIGICTLTAIDLPTNQTILNLDFTSYCKSALGVYNCLNNLTHSGACSTASAPANTIDPMAYLQAVSQNVYAKIGDVCNQDGSPSACINDLFMCHDDLAGQNNASDTNTLCQTLSAFLECSSKLPCGLTLSPIVENYKQTLENEESKKQCPAVGSCTDRFAVCGRHEQELMNGTLPNTACKQVRSCFDFVKNDPNCVNEKQTFANEEQDADAFISAQCGGGESQLMSLTVFMVSLMLCMQQIL